MTMSHFMGEYKGLGARRLKQLDSKMKRQEEQATRVALDFLIHRSHKCISS